MAFDRLIRNTSEVLTLTGSPPDAERALAPILGGVVGIAAGKIAYLGPEEQLPEGAVGPSTEVLDAQGGFVGPGFVDPHTHAVFAGERAHEFELRNRGASYLEIAQAGGGIVSTVQATRAASEEELVALAAPRLRRMLEFGITTAEVKSGYGLHTEAELKMLRAVRRLGETLPISLVPTLLCAHAIPPEYKERRGAYLDLCTEEIIPEAARLGLARFCDIFTEKGAFDVPESRRILQAGLAAGLIPRLHADQLSNLGAVELACELGAASADHLEQVSDAGIAALARAGVSACLVPVSTLFLRVRPFAPGRRLWDAGVTVALGTNVNPGSAMSENLPLTLGLACLENGLTPAEAYWAATRGAARALRLEEAGRLQPGGPADLVIFSCASFRHLPYHLGINHARVVLRGGQVVARQPADAAPCV
ncbi:MAG: imidazolonepropionase [Myxococcota bacterium]|nr:imidazolonepropionase [Myxococcota bacterium]